MKRIICLLLTLALLLTGCGKKEVPPPESPAGPETVRLTVWGAAEDEALMEEMIASFQARYAGEASFSITYQAQGESGCKDALLADLEGGPDVFTFADDQLSALAAAGALDPVENAAEIAAASLTAAVEAASVGGTLYAYPLTADNGYFLYYNKAYFSPEDVESLNRMTDIAAQAGRLMVMDWSSAWYYFRS